MPGSDGAVTKGKGAVNLTDLRGKTPDSIRVHPYDPSAHAACKYELEPDHRPEDYQPNKSFYFDIAKRKMQVLMLGLVVGGVIIGISLAVMITLL